MPRAARRLFAFFLFAIAALAAVPALHKPSSDILRALLRPDTGTYAISVRPKKATLRPSPLALTAGRVARHMPPLKPGSAAILPVEDLPALADDGGLRRLRLAQGDVAPRAIVIREGNYDLPTLRTALGDTPALSEEGGVHTLRLPLLVAPGASLSLRGALRLSLERGAFLLSEGDLFVLDADVSGWSEAAAAPAPFRAEKDFRPFIAATGGARLFAADSQFRNLGYRAPRAYGLTLSSRAGGIVAGNVFEGLYHGFHAGGAAGITLSGNTYRDSIAQGIFAGDGARRLTVSGNTVRATRAGHGIFLSRAGADIWLAGNDVRGSGGSGIAVRRSGPRLALADNIVSDNKGDGIVFSDTASATVSGGRISAADGAGIRLRGGTVTVEGVAIAARGDAFRLEGGGVLELSGINLLAAGPILPGASSDAILAASIHRKDVVTRVSP